MIFIVAQVLCLHILYLLQHGNRVNNEEDRNAKLCNDQALSKPGAAACKGESLLQYADDLSA